MREYLYLIAFSFLLLSCSDTSQTEKLFVHFLNRHVESIKPINLKYNEAVWATYSGKSSFTELLKETRLTDSLYKNAGKPIEYYQNLLNNVYDNSSDFEILLKIKNSGLITDPLLKRQFIKVFQQYISIQNNWDETENKKTKLFEQFFELKRSESAYWDSVSITKNKNARIEWFERFTKLTDDYRAMIKSMNNDAKQLGYQNYYELLMDFNGVDYVKLEEMTAVVDKETQNDYAELLKISQDDIHERFNISVDEMTPKHYSYTVNKMMMPYDCSVEYSKDEFLEICTDFFAMGDYKIEEILNNSDIWYQKEKINQSFFFCADIERSDLRLYANINPSPMGIHILFHELGHAVHFQSVGADVPYLLKEPHTIATEAVAIYFSDKFFYSKALKNIMNLSEPVDSRYFDAFKDPSRLAFLRKLIRTIQFEKSIFENPDQDFNQLWWSLTAKYLQYNIQETDRLPEWISNQHIINASGIHVFYLYAFAVSAQLEAYFPDDIIGPLKGFMRPGDSMSWNDLLRSTTGEELNLNYLFNSYRKENTNDVPITYNVGDYSSFSLFEEKHKDELLNHNVQTIY